MEVKNIKKFNKENFVETDVPKEVYSRIYNECPSSYMTVEFAADLINRNQFNVLNHLSLVSALCPEDFHFQELCEMFFNYCDARTLAKSA